MNTAIRYRMAIGAIAITVVLAACGVQAAPQPTSPTPTGSPTPTVAPSDTPSEAPTQEPSPELDVVGTITVADGLVFSGPGISISEALANPTDGPNLVNGSLWLVPDGTFYLTESVADATEPTFDGPMLEVLNLPYIDATWNLDNADVTGVQQAGDLLFYETYPILGTIES